MKSSAHRAPLTIGDLAQRFGLATHVLRHWESRGLLAPTRISGQRRYQDADVYRVATILRAKQAGLSLEKIGQVLSSHEVEQRAEILEASRAELTDRIMAAQHALQLIDSALSCRHADFTQCQRYQNAINSLAHHARKNDG